MNIVMDGFRLITRLSSQDDEYRIDSRYSSVVMRTNFAGSVILLIKTKQNRKLNRPLLDTENASRRHEHRAVPNQNIDSPQTLAKEFLEASLDSLLFIPMQPNYSPHCPITALRQPEPNLRH